MHRPLMRALLRPQVTILDRHHLFKDALAELLRQRLPGIELKRIEHLDQLAGSDPGLLVVDINLPGLRGLTGLAALTRKHPDTHIIAVADDWPEKPDAIFDHGAMAGISKSATADEFIEAIQTVSTGNCWLQTPRLSQPFCRLHVQDFRSRIEALTPRRQRIVSLVAKGMLNKQIAYELGLKESTIKAHVSEIMRAVGLRNRTQLAIEANRML